MFTDTLQLNRIPRDIRTVTSWLDIRPSLIYYNCCSKCFALYPTDNTPESCTYLDNQVPGLQNTESPTVTMTDSSLAGMCSEPLFEISQNNAHKSIRLCAFQDLKAWLAKFICRPSTESLLDQSLSESRKPFSHKGKILDIHHSYVWKSFRGPDGLQFTATTGNLVFGMFVDGINPFGNKISGHKVSITFLILACLTLPFEERYLPENIFLAGIAPGPHEPSLEEMNWVLTPIVSQLKELWIPGLQLSATPSYPEGRLIRVALLPFIADLPALRRTLGFAGVRAKHFCSVCDICDVNNIDSESWVYRTSSGHKKLALEARDTKTAKERIKIFEEHGVRYSTLIELPYWKMIDYQVVDSMHNLLLGLLNWNVQRFWWMSDEKTDGDVEPLPVGKTEIKNLKSKQRVRCNSAPASEPLEGTPFLDEHFPSDTCSDDPDFDPAEEENQGWNGEWTAPWDEDIVFDKVMVAQINCLMPKIYIPTWIKRALPVLGKASFGKLKADEWRNLFTIQLPLILIPMWSGLDQNKIALLQNFGHLVSLTNLALKRSTSGVRIAKYRDHLMNYLEGAKQLFTHCKFAPNHHMAFHLADCLEKFGPVRAWWSFVFERKMGDILKANHNNRIGEFVLISTCVFAISG